MVFRIIVFLIHIIYYCLIGSVIRANQMAEISQTFVLEKSENEKRDQFL